MRRRATLTPTAAPQCYPRGPRRAVIAGARDLRQTLAQRRRRPQETCGADGGIRQDQVDVNHMTYAGIRSVDPRRLIAVTSDAFRPAGAPTPGVRLIDPEHTKTLAMCCSLIGLLIDAGVLSGTVDLPTACADRRVETQPGYLFARSR